MDVGDWLVLAAIILGPIMGAWTAIWLDHRRAGKQRKMDIFRTLMRTRRTPMWPEHVGALNLAEIEFHKNGEVIGAWKALFEHLGQPHPRKNEEEILDGLNDQEKASRNKKYEERLGQERQSLLSKLLHKMATSLGFKIEQLEIFEGGYTPQGWADVELEQMAIRRLFADIYLGKRMFPIGVYYFPDMNPQAGKDTE